MPKERTSSRATPRFLYGTVEFVQNPTTGRFVPVQSVSSGTPADAAVSGIAATPGTNVGIVIPSAQKFSMTDLTVTNTGTVTQLVTLTDGSGGTVKETIEIAAAATAKFQYLTPKRFSTSVFAFAATASIVNVSVDGTLG